MKKLVYLASLLLTIGMATSCSKEEVGGTATESMAGDWYVTYDAVDANGNIVIPDFNEGRSHLLTYNLASNLGDSIFVDDEENFLGVKVATGIDLNGKTFSHSVMTKTLDGVGTKYVSDTLQITDGKIIYGGGRQKNGSVADSISFYLQFSRDDYADTYEFVKYHVHGVRYSGLTEND